MSETTLTPSQIRQQARLDQVLDAAAICFFREGFHGSSMSKLAVEAQMSVGHIYHYFENKDAVICALIRREHKQIDEKVALISATDPEKFVAAIRERVRKSLLEDTPVFQSVMTLEIMAESQRNPMVAQIVHDFDKKMHARFASLFRGKLGLENVDGRVELLFTLLHGLPQRLLRNPQLDKDSLLPLIDASLDLVFGA